MKKVIFSLVASLVVAAAVAAPVYAVEDPHEQPPRVRRHREQPASAVLDLYEKVPEGEWPIVEDGAYGKLVYMTEDQPYQNRRLFRFMAKGLDAGVDYTLMRYTEPTGAWATTHVAVCLGDATADADGDIDMLRGELLDGGPKVWLVLSDDVDCDAELMTDWNPTEYLFENNLL